MWDGKSWREPAAPARRAAPQREWAPVERDLAAELAEVLSRPIGAPSSQPEKAPDPATQAVWPSAGQAPVEPPPARHRAFPAWQPHRPGEDEVDDQPAAPSSVPEATAARPDRPVSPDRTDAQVIRRDVFRSTRAVAEPAHGESGQSGAAPYHDRLAAMLEERQTARMMRSEGGGWEPPAPTPPAPTQPAEVERPGPQGPAESSFEVRTTDEAVALPMSVRHDHDATGDDAWTADPTWEEADTSPDIASAAPADEEFLDPRRSGLPEAREDRRRT